MTRCVAHANGGESMVWRGVANGCRHVAQRNGGGGGEACHREIENDNLWRR